MVALLKKSYGSSNSKGLCFTNSYAMQIKTASVLYLFKEIAVPQTIIGKPVPRSSTTFSLGFF